MLAVIVSVPAAVAGRASGIVMVGFLGGLTIGSPLAGAVVDRFGSYQPVWAASLVLCAVGAAVINPRISPRTAAPRG
jgi:MFS family permease